MLQGCNHDPSSRGSKTPTLEHSNPCSNSSSKGGQFGRPPHVYFSQLTVWNPTFPASWWHDCWDSSSSKCWNLHLWVLPCSDQSFLAICQLYLSVGLVDESQNIVPQWPNERFYVYLVLCEGIFLRNQYYGKYLTSKNCPKIKKWIGKSYRI